jgi:hypothetical protein
MPAPSPITKPSRVESKGRAAVLGLSRRDDMAVSLTKPVIPSGWIMLWRTPANMISASPARMISKASPIACVLAAQAVMQLLLGPRQPNSAARCDRTMLGSCSTSRCGFMSSAAVRAHFGASTAFASAFHDVTLLQRTGRNRAIPHRPPGTSPCGAA